MNKKVIITGATGQDGSYMADYLLENTDYDIFGMVRRASKPDYTNLTEALKNPRFKLVVGDLSDSQSIEKVVEKIKPDYFINLAAQSFVGSSWELPEQTMDINATGVMRCLEAIVRHAPGCRFYNAGSSEEFGDVQYTPQDEKHPLRARSPYGASKIAARQVVKTYRESYNLYAVQGYLFNHESPRRGEEFVTRKITLGVAKIKNAIDKGLHFEPIELGNLDARRDWSHAADFVDGIWRMLNQDKYNPLLNGSMHISGELIEIKKVPTLNEVAKEYVLSSNETHSIREFIELAFKEAGIYGKWSFRGTVGNDVTPENEVYETLDGKILIRVNLKFYRPADVEVLLGDSSLARKELDWEPKYNFESLVKEMVKEDYENYKL
jgi:GDPmannose 4,6-dehydratase